VRSARDPQSYHLSPRLSERKDADSYFQSKAWNDNLLVLIDDFGSIIHSHALVESSLDPEQLIKIGEEHIRRKGLELIRSTSIVFNSYGIDIGKLVYLLTKPEIVVEPEWHFNRSHHQGRVDSLFPSRKALAQEANDGHCLWPGKL
jgi:hypothetical protein